MRNCRGNNFMALMRKLNPIIRGWTNYHRHVCSAQVFEKLDWYIYTNVLRWIRRGDNTKSFSWALKKYLKKVNGASHFGIISKVSGKFSFLQWASDTKIRRCIKVKALSNPYLNEYRKYFALRSSCDNLMSV